jgi:hypothetical protein
VLLPAFCLLMANSWPQLSMTHSLDWLKTQSQSQSQSPSYYTTGGLLPISSSWWQTPWDSIYNCILSDEKMGLSFTIAAGSRQRSHSQVRVPRDLLPYFTVSELRVPQTGGQGSRIYMLQAQSGPVIPLGTGFPFRRFLRLERLRWRYSTPPPHGALIE